MTENYQNFSQEQLQNSLKRAIASTKTLIDQAESFDTSRNSRRKVELDLDRLEKKIIKTFGKVGPKIIEGMREIAIMQCMLCGLDTTLYLPLAKVIAYNNLFAHLKENLDNVEIQSRKKN